MLLFLVGLTVILTTNKATLTAIKWDLDAFFFQGRTYSDVQLEVLGFFLVNTKNTLESYLYD